MREEMTVRLAHGEKAVLQFSMPGSPDRVFSASALVHPCVMYADHGSARPAFTQGHHLFPMYLQKRLWNEVRLDDIVWLCGTCHDNLHGWLNITMGAWSALVAAQEVPPRARRYAEDVVAWFKAEEGALSA